jgi:hypothetical protein
MILIGIRLWAVLIQTRIESIDYKTARAVLGQITYGRGAKGLHKNQRIA